MCAAKYTEFYDDSINIESNFHPYKSWSQLAEESKGGYLTGTITVPIGVKTIELALYSKAGTPHPNLLFLSPNIKQVGEKPKEVTEEGYKVILELDAQNELKVVPLAYWPKKPTKELLTSMTWNKQSRQIMLGPTGLRLSILKPNTQNNGKNKNITLDKMIKFRNITEEKAMIDLSKVKLGATFVGSVNKLILSNKVILDRARYYIEPSECSTRTICTSGEHIIYIHHNASVKQDSKLQLQIIQQTEFNGLVLDDITVSSNNHVNTPNLIKFKVNLDDATRDFLEGGFTAFLNVFVDDEDVKRLSFNEMSFQTPLLIKVFTQLEF